MTDIIKELFKLMTSPNYLVTAAEDFVRWAVNMVDPWAPAALNAGTAFQFSTDVTKDHPGLIECRSHATNANSGYYAMTREISFLLGGEEWTSCVIKFPTFHANTRVRFGWMDSLTEAIPFDGVWFELQYNAIFGFSASNGSVSQTESICDIAENAWYRLEIELNSNATEATFRIYSEAGVLLGSERLLTNIPTGSGRLTGHGILAYNSAPPGTYVRLCIFDFMAYRCFRQLVR